MATTEASQDHGVLFEKVETGTNTTLVAKRAKPSQISDDADTETISASITELGSARTGVHQSAPPAPPSMARQLAKRALERDEILRSRQLGFIAVLLSPVIALFVPFLDLSRASTVLVLAACVVTFVANGLMVYVCSEPSRYRMSIIAPLWLVSSAAIAVGVCSFGVFSPAPLVSALGIYFVALGASTRLAYAVWLITAVIVAVFTIAPLAGWWNDPGLVTGDDLSQKQRVLLLALLEMMLLATVVLARYSRQATERAVVELERTSRDLAERDALLDEARLELAAALGNGGVGAWTGRSLGDYKIGELLGRGGMGEVYEAIGEKQERPVAIKVLTPAAAIDSTIVRRFQREAMITAGLSSPNIVKVHQVSTPDASVPYLVMERLVGQDLADMLRERNVLASDELMVLVTSVAAGLDAAHQAGVVHRDIKPRNLFSDKGPLGSTWKILDFGVSKLSEHGGTLTQGNVVGTPAYMAPEQAIGEDDVGPRADVYALAAIAYRCLTGRPPFRGKTTAATLYNVVYERAERPTALVRTPDAIDIALALGMAKDPTVRPDSASAFAEILRGALTDSLSNDAWERGVAIDEMWARR